LSRQVSHLYVSVYLNLHYVLFTQHDPRSGRTFGDRQWNYVVCLRTRSYLYGNRARHFNGLMIDEKTKA
jgi:hypothetical protein